MEDFITISLGSSFFLNAGICGLLEFLNYNDAEENIDYKIDEQNLYLSVHYLKVNNIPEMYVNTMAEMLGETTKFYRVTENDRRAIEKLNNTGVDILSKKELKDLNDKYIVFQQKFLSKSYASAYKLLSRYDDIEPINENIINDFKKCNDLHLKFEKYNNIIRLLKQKRVRNILIYTELIYNSFKLFFAENSQSKKITCLCSTDQSYSETYKKNFYDPLIAELNIPENKKASAICIECRNSVSSKNKRGFTFLSDTADDLNRKKSYYWNCKPDAYVCPVCAFVYTFIPIGFAFLGTDAVFINSNSSIRSMYSIMKTCKEKSDRKESSVNRVMRTLTSEKISALSNIINNIEVVMNSNDYSHFKFDVIDKNIVEGLKLGKSYLSFLENKWIRADKKSTIAAYYARGNHANELYVMISVYDMVLDHIFYKRDLYYALNMLMKFEMKNGDFSYLMNILKLELIFNGGPQMNELNKKVDYAFVAGKSLRKSILGNDADKSDSEDDNRLRSFVYRLVNLSSVGDREQFIDTVVRIYSGFNLTIPSIFKDCYVSDEMFKAIAHGFILGLKYVPYKKENKEEI